MERPNNIFNKNNEWANILCHEDTRTAQSVYALFTGAEKLIEETSGNLQSLLDIERKICTEEKQEFNTMAHLIVKAAISKTRVMSLTEDTHIEIVVPMYHERTRMAPRANSNCALLDNSFTPDINGEDALLRKVIEMEWLIKDSKLDYNLIFVDDICDQDSGGYASKLIEENKLHKCKVLFLADEIKNTGHESIKELAIQTITDKGESIRGGSLCLGFAEAVTKTKQSEKKRNTMIGYVDADSSYSLTQIGIPLLEIINSPRIQAMTASRQHELTYMEPAKGESQTSHRSSGLIRLKQVVGYLRNTVVGRNVPADTQSGFKLFRPEILEKTLIQPNKAHNFSYDTQLLSRISRLCPYRDSIKTFGVVCIDSDELSTANNGVTYFSALKIIQTIAEEVDLSKQANEMWLLDFLTRDLDNYKLAIRLLDDKTDLSEWFFPYSEYYNSVTDLRAQIHTDRDTTAVGDYFTSEICEKLEQILKKISLQDL
ncbi:hypothetical protein BH10PAT1_BH10PAT1_3850 [soil metagenome]